MAAALPCPEAAPHSAVADAIDFILHSRESVSGVVCIGGWDDLSHLALSHLKVSLFAIALSIIVTVPVGLYLGHYGKGEFFAISASNVGRAVPSLALLAFFVAFLGVGFNNVVAVLTLLAIPPILTNTFVGVTQVDRETVDAARGMGLTEAQIVRKVEFPLALPTIFAGLRTSAVAVVATATIAPLANVESLGNPILEQQTYGAAGVLGAAILVALITLAVDALLALAQRLLTPKVLTVATRSSAPRRSFFTVPARTRTET